MSTPSVNYTNSGEQFSIPADETEFTDPTLFIIDALKALENHTHASTRGLAVARLASSVASAAPTTITGGGLTISTGGLTVTAGGITITAGALTVGGGAPTVGAGQLGIGGGAGAVGNGALGNMQAPAKGTGSGPTFPQTVNAFLTFNLAGTVIYVPYFT